MPIIKRAVNAVRNPPTLEERLALLTPEQRAAYDAQMAQSQAAIATADDHRLLGGPAGRHVYGPTTQEQMAQLAEPGMLRGIAKMAKQSLPQAPMTGGDPAQDRAARDAARAPYRAPDAVPVEIHRVATRGKTQVAELLASFGARAPTACSASTACPTGSAARSRPHSEKGRVVEWDIVHAPGRGAASGAAARRHDVRGGPAVGRAPARRAVGARRGPARSRSASPPGSGRSSAPGSRACRSSGRSTAAASEQNRPCARS